MERGGLVLNPVAIVTSHEAVEPSAMSHAEHVCDFMQQRADGPTRQVRLFHWTPVGLAASGVVAHEAEDPRARGQVCEAVHEVPFGPREKVVHGDPHNAECIAGDTSTQRT